MDEQEVAVVSEAEQIPEPVTNKKLHRLIPRHQWVLLRKISLEQEQTEGGIIIDKSQHKSSLGIVIAFGAKVKGLKVGQTVMYSNFSMALHDVQELTGDKNLFQVRDEEVYSVVEPIESDVH